MFSTNEIVYCYLFNIVHLSSTVRFTFYIVFYLVLLFTSLSVYVVISSFVLKDIGP